MAAVPSLPVDMGGHRMSLRSRTSARQTPRQLSTSKVNQSESQLSPSEMTRENTKPQTQAQSRSGVQRHSLTYDSSDDEILMPMKLSALTEALLNDEQYKYGAEYDQTGERPASPSTQPPPRVCARRSALAASSSSISNNRGNTRESVWQLENRRNTRTDSLQLPPAKPTSPAASQGRGSSLALRMRVVRLGSSTGRETLQDELRQSMSTSSQETRVESRERSNERESHFHTQAEMGERLLNQKYAQTSINTPVSVERTTRVSVGSSGRRTHSTSSSAITFRRFGAGGDAITPAKPTTTERAYAADSVGSVSRNNNSGKKEDLELRSMTRLNRVISVSGGLFGGPARRGRHRQTEEDAEAYDEELLTTPQDHESHQAQDAQDNEPAATNQTAMALSTSNPPMSAARGSPFQRKHTIPAAIGKRASLARFSDMHAQRTTSNSELPHHGPVPLPEIPSVHDKDVQASAPANFRRASKKVFNEEVGKPASPVSLGTGSFVPQRAPISLGGKALAIKSQNTPYLSASSLPPPKTPVLETLTATQLVKKRQILVRVNDRAYPIDRGMTPFSLREG